MNNVWPKQISLLTKTVLLHFEWNIKARDHLCKLIVANVMTCSKLCLEVMPPFTLRIYTRERKELLLSHYKKNVLRLYTYARETTISHKCQNSLYNWWKNANFPRFRITLQAKHERHMINQHAMHWNNVPRKTLVQTLWVNILRYGWKWKKWQTNNGSIAN